MNLGQKNLAVPIYYSSNLKWKDRLLCSHNKYLNRIITVVVTHTLEIIRQTRKGFKKLQKVMKNLSNYFQFIVNWSRN